MCLARRLSLCCPFVAVLTTFAVNVSSLPVFDRETLLALRLNTWWIISVGDMEVLAHCSCLGYRFTSAEWLHLRAGVPAVDGKGSEVGSWPN